MDGGQFEIVIVLPFLLLGVAVVAALFWVPEPGARRGTHPPTQRDRLASRAGLIGSWLGLTVLTIWCGALVAFLALHALLFTLGQGAASVGLFLTVVVLEAVPFFWAIVFLRRSRRSRRDGIGQGDRKRSES